MTLQIKGQYENGFMNPYNRFLYALKAPETKRQYPKRFEIFLDFVDITGSTIEERLLKFYEMAKSNNEWVQNVLMSFIMFQKDRVSKGEINESTIPNYYKPVKLFCDMNDILINWKIITRGMPRGRKAANDRAPTLDEIHKILRYPDVRIKPLVLVMVSSGIRVGAWDYLKWKHVIPMHKDKSIVAAKIVVYAEEPDQHISFITPEAYYALKDWMDFRSSYGERITDESWVMRDLWRTTNITYGAKLGYAKTPKKFKSSGIRNLISKALFQQNVRPLLNEGQKRHEFKAAHGFRKYFKTKTEQMMKTSNVELLMGHDLGVSHSYYKPLIEKILEDYLKAIDLLTVNKNNNDELEKEIKQLQEKNENSEHIISSKLQERDDAIKSLSDQVMILMMEIQKLKR